MPPAPIRNRRQDTPAAHPRPSASPPPKPWSRVRGKRRSRFPSHRARIQRAVHPPHQPQRFHPPALLLPAGIVTRQGRDRAQPELGRSAAEIEPGARASGQPPPSHTAPCHSRPRPVASTKAVGGRCTSDSIAAVSSCSDLPARLLPHVSVSSWPASAPTPNIWNAPGHCATRAIPANR